MHRLEGRKERIKLQRIQENVKAPVPFPSLLLTVAEIEYARNTERQSPPLRARARPQPQDRTLRVLPIYDCTSVIYNSIVRYFDRTCLRVASKGT